MNDPCDPLVSVAMAPMSRGTNIIQTYFKMSHGQKTFATRWFAESADSPETSLSVALAACWVSSEAAWHRLLLEFASLSLTPSNSVASHDIGFAGGLGLGLSTRS